MIICNLAIWGSCSFIDVDYNEGNVSLYIINEIVFGETNWRFVTTFLYPLVLYFRFHSAKMILTLQELKLQGIKIRDGVVFSRYSRAQ